ncbi:MAG: hypothetical protein LBG13_00415 [Holosporales bacterium]|jgi:hypothetical protein|nr:hypothetical protein [Holosporales bacterium]
MKRIGILIMAGILGVGVLVGSAGASVFDVRNASVFDVRNATGERFVSILVEDMSKKLRSGCSLEQVKKFYEDCSDVSESELQEALLLISEVIIIDQDTPVDKFAKDMKEVLSLGLSIEQVKKWYKDYSDVSEKEWQEALRKLLYIVVEITIDQGTYNDFLSVVGESKPRNENEALKANKDAKVFYSEFNNVFGNKEYTQCFHLLHIKAWYDSSYENTERFVNDNASLNKKLGAQAKGEPVDIMVQPIASSHLGNDFLNPCMDAEQFKKLADENAAELVNICKCVYVAMAKRELPPTAKMANDTSFTLIMNAIKNKEQLAKDAGVPYIPLFDEKLIDELVQAKKVCEESLTLCAPEKNRFQDLPLQNK